jgi:hypothetical protein
MQNSPGRLRNCKMLLGDGSRDGRVAQPDILAGDNPDRRDNWRGDHHMLLTGQWRHL